MIKLNSRCLLLLIWLLRSSCINAQAPDSIALISGLNPEEKLLANEYQIFLSDDQQTKNYWMLQKALCYKDNKNYSGTYQTLKRIKPARMPDSFIFRTYYEAMFANYLKGDFEECKSNYAALINSVTDSSLLNKTALLQTLLSIEFEDWDDAKGSLKEYLETKNMSLNVDSIFNGLPSQKNVNKARLLSYLIPGSGQLYAGNPVMGLESSALNAAAIAYIICHIADAYYITGITSGTWLFFKFYFGGVENAGNMAAQKNMKRMFEYKQELKQKIIHLTD